MIQIKTASFLLLLLFLCHMQIQVSSICCRSTRSFNPCEGCGNCTAHCCDCDSGCCYLEKRDTPSSSSIKYLDDTRYFYASDLNGDSVVDYSEFNHLISIINNDARAQHNDTTNQAEFDKIDKNKDGKIQPSEFSKDLQ